MNTIAIIAAAFAVIILGVLVVKFVKSKSKVKVDVFAEDLSEDKTIQTASELCKVNVAGPEPTPEPDTDNTYTPGDTSEIAVVEPEEINPISLENQICPFEIKEKNGDIIKTDADRTDGPDPLAELEKIIASAPKTETKKTSKKGGKKTTKSTKATKSVKKTKGKKTQKFTVPVVKVVEVPAETPKKRGRKSKKKEG